MTEAGLVLDTTAAIAWIRKERGIPDLLASQARVALPVIALGELVFGAEVSAQPARNLARVHDLVGLCELVPVTEEIAVRYAGLRKALTEAGCVMPNNDLWIAATAVEHGLSLLGRDKHFAVVPQLVYREF